MTSNCFGTRGTYCSRRSGSRGRSGCSARACWWSARGGSGRRRGSTRPRRGGGHTPLAAGVRVDLTNLQRQILHPPATIGRPKVDSGRETLARFNAEVEIVPVERRVEGEALHGLVSRAHVVLD